MRRLLSGVMLALLVVSMLVLTFRIQPTRSSPGTITVPDDYPTIQEAINAASDGDTIFIKSGTYHESVLVNKSVSLVGEKASDTCLVIWSSDPNTGNIMTVCANSVNINCLTLRGYGHVWTNNGTQSYYGPFWSSLYLKNVNECNITGNILIGDLFGIVLENSSRNMIMQNVIQQNWGAAVYLKLGSNNNLIENNTISDLNQDGIIVHSASTTIVGNEIYSCREAGIWVYGSNKTTMSRNTMANNSYNLYVEPDSLETCSIDESNTVNGKPICFMIGQHDRTIPPNTGYVAIVDSTDIHIDNVTISEEGEGIVLYNSSGCVIQNVNVSNCRYGFTLKKSGNNTVINCTINVFDKSCYGYEMGSTCIYLAYSPQNMFRNVLVNSNYTRLDIFGQSVLDYFQDIDTSNKLNGMTVYYFLNRTNMQVTPVTFQDPGYIACVNCSNLCLHDFSDCSNILYSYVNDSIISNVTSSIDPKVYRTSFVTLSIYGSFNVTVADTEISESFTSEYVCHTAVQLEACSNCKIMRCNLSKNDNALVILNCSNISAVGNTISDNNVGICSYTSLGNALVGNNITNNEYSGMVLYCSSDCSVTENTIEGHNYCGVELGNSSNNSFIHNSFVGNSQQVSDDYWSYPEYLSPSVNAWDGGYPTGGNYWSDYTGNDTSSGPGQNETGSDNIGDSPYVIDANNRDNYPLMRSAGVPYTNGTVYIRVDGSVDPSGAPIWRQGDIYTLTNDIISDTAGIIIEADYVTLNGQGYSIEGTNKTGIGIDLSARQNVSITNTTIRNFDEGIHLEDSANNSLSANTITYNNHGISLCSSSLNRIANNTVDFNDQAGIWFWFLPQGNSNNAVIGNEVAYNGWCGIRLVASSSNVLRNNTILGSAANFGVEGWDESHYFNDVDNSNTVDGKPIYYWVNKRDLQVPTDAGFVALVNCTNMTVANLSIEYEMQGLVVEYTDNSRIENTTVSFCQEGIRLEGSSNNTVSENHVYGSGYGIGFRENAISSGNIVTHNELRSNADGILLWAAEENIIVDNEILNSWEFAVTCVSIQCPVSSNMIYHNNFINNLQRTYAYHAGQNEWDDGYPSSGNYWSDYNGIDLYRSPYQNETGSDGIGDTPYTIDSNNQDNYPLMGPFSNMDDISTVSNSTISSFQFSGTTISFNVNGEPDTTGFCTLTVQHSTMPPPYIVTVDGKPIQYTTIFENDTMSVIYFTYQHSTHEVTIIGAQSTSTQGGGGGRMPYMN